MNDMTAPKEYKLSKGSAYYIFTLLFLLYFFDYVDRTVVTSLAPFIQKEWSLTDVQTGLLMSVVYWSIVVFVFPVSILVDRWSRKRTIGVMALLWTAATVACAFTKTFPQLLLARAGIGIGEAGYAPAGTAMLSGLFPPERRSRMMGLWNISIPLGITVGIGLGGFIPPIGAGAMPSAWWPFPGPLSPSFFSSSRIIKLWSSSKQRIHPLPAKTR
jgi:MFS family permease